MLDTVETSGSVLMISNAGRTVCAVVWSAPDTMNRTIEMFADNLHRYEKGEPLHGPVDLAAGY